MQDIRKMKDWEILEYLRYERNWMVQSHYSREDIEKYFGHLLRGGRGFQNDDEWAEFCEFACDYFDNVKEGLMRVIVSKF